MDNFLMLISGTKRVVLFPPTDALFMYLQGTCSDSGNVPVCMFSRSCLW